MLVNCVAYQSGRKLADIAPAEIRAYLTLSAPTESIGERKGGLVPAPPWGAIRLAAALSTLGGVDAVQANALAVDLQRVAVDDGGDAGNGFGQNETWQ